MLVINSISVTVHHKKVRSENTMQEKRARGFSLELDMTLTSGGNETRPVFRLNKCDI